MTPKQFVRGEWFVGTAVLASTVYVVCDAGLHLSLWPATLIAVGVAFAFRYTALVRHWEEPEPLAPPDAHSHGSAALVEDQPPVGAQRE